MPQNPKQSNGFQRVSRRTALKWSAAALGGIATRSIVAADGFPDRPINIVVPHDAGGYNDRLARALQRFLQEELGQPLIVINRPGAGSLLGHSYFTQQRADGYTILCGSAIPFIATTILLHNAPYTVDDFQMVNLPSRDYTLAATRVGSEIESWSQLVETLRADPRALSIGVQTGSSDYLNIMFAFGVEGIDTDALRLVMYNGGAPVRTATAGGHVDVGFVGAEGYLPLRDQIQSLLLFSGSAMTGFEDVPTVVEYAAETGQEIDYLDGSQRGWSVHAALREQYPERYAMLVGALERVSRNPECVRTLEQQQLAADWYGPEESHAAYLRAFETMQRHVHLFQRR